MSEEPKPPELDQVLTVIQSLFEANYALDKRDRDLVFRLSQYMKNMVGLTLKEEERLKECGMMRKDGKLVVDPVFQFRGVILPAYYMKCIMAFHDMIHLETDKGETNETE